MAGFSYIFWLDGSEVKLKPLERRQNGYVALASVLVIASIVMTLGASVALLAINDAQSALATSKSFAVSTLVDSCAEEALLYLNENNSLPSSVVLPELTCSVTENPKSGNIWNFTVSGTLEGYSKSKTVDVTRASTLTVNSWVEN